MLSYFKATDNTGQYFKEHTNTVLFFLLIGCAVIARLPKDHCTPEQCLIRSHCLKAEVLRSYSGYSFALQ